MDAGFAGFLLLLAASLLLGGSSRGHAFQVALVELCALPLLGIALLRAWDVGHLHNHRTALILLLGVIAVPLAQLIPLPAAIWTTLPGREQATLALELAGLAPGWTPMSLAPDLTLRSLWALIPPAAIFLGTLCLAGSQRRWAVVALIVLTLAGVVLAAAQILGGDRFYPWAHTTRGTVTGFFANRNHLATLCLMVLPFCAAIGGTAVRRGGKGVAFAAMLVGVLVVAVALARSRAGLSLAGPTLAASAAVAWMAAGQRRPTPALMSLAGGAAVAVTLVLSIGLGPILDRFDQDVTTEARFARWPLVADTAQTYLPTGAGMGTFDRVYRSVEPVTEVDETYFNQAHNDYLETWLEGGWLSIAMLAALLLWFGRRSVAAWTAPPSEDATVKRAASVAICVVLAHSVVDYPLRTLAILCVTAFCAALMEGQSPPKQKRGTRAAPDLSEKPGATFP